MAGTAGRVGIGKSSSQDQPGGPGCSVRSFPGGKPYGGERVGPEREASKGLVSDSAGRKAPSNNEQPGQKDREKRPLPPQK